MAAVQNQPPEVLPRQTVPQRSNTLVIPAASSSAPKGSTLTSENPNPRASRVDTFSPVNQNGSYEFDRVIKSGYVQKRTQKTKTWKSVFLVLRPNVLYIYKSEKEDKLRYKLYLSDLTAVTSLKDPKQKRQHVFGLFSPSKNFHFQAQNAHDAEEWVEFIRRDARIDEEEEEMFMASPGARRQSYAGAGPVPQPSGGAGRMDQILSSSPEPIPGNNSRRPTMIAEYSGLSGNEVASHSDLSEAEGQPLRGASIESLTLHQQQQQQSTQPISQQGSNTLQRPDLGHRNPSQTSVGIGLERDPDRVIWQGWLWFLRSKRGVKQWKNLWAVLRPRNLILYKDESEYTAQYIIPLSAILNVVDIDPVSKSKAHCLQVITDEKSYRFCAHGEEPLVQCLGAFKSLLAKRRELEVRAAAAAREKEKARKEGGAVGAPAATGAA